jgi:hypothetical protein
MRLPILGNPVCFVAGALKPTHFHDAFAAFECRQYLSPRLGHPLNQRLIAAVADAQPKNLWWRTHHVRATREIVVFGHYNQIIVFGEFKDFARRSLCDPSYRSHVAHQILVA